MTQIEAIAIEALDEIANNNWGKHSDNFQGAFIGRAIAAEARERIRDLSSSEEGLRNEKFVYVPVDPTADMIRAAVNKSGIEAWDAMISARPK